MDHNLQIKKFDEPKGVMYLVQIGKDSILINSNKILLKKNEPYLENCRGVLLTFGDIAHASRAAEMVALLRVPLFAHQDHLAQLQRLPALSERAGLCGVKVPSVNRFVKKGDQLQFGQMKVEVQEERVEGGTKLIYSIGSHQFR